MRFNLLVTSKGVIEGGDVSHDGTFVWLGNFDQV